jgi:hypothetical protein
MIRWSMVILVVQGSVQASIFSSCHFLPAILQVDGNLVIKDSTDNLVTQTSTAGQSTVFLWNQKDGNLVLYR